MSTSSPSAIACKPPAQILAAQLAGELFVHPRHHALADEAVAGATPWAGIGLCGAELSRGLPVDVLALLLALDDTRVALRAEHALVVIADSNARAVGFAKADVERRAAVTHARLAELAALLQLPLRFARGADVARWSDAARVARRLPHAGPYEVHQLAQMLALARAGATLKVGWRARGMLGDEAYFDRLYGVVADQAPALGFVYAVGGRGLHPSRPRACPYVVMRPGERILLDPGERIDAKLAAAQAEAPREVLGYRRLLGKLGRELARRCGERIARPHEQRVQVLLDRLAPVAS